MSSKKTPQIVAKKSKTRKSSKKHWEVGESWIQETKCSRGGFRKAQSTFRLIAILDKLKTKSGLRYKVAVADMHDDFSGISWPRITTSSRIDVERLLKSGNASRYASRWRGDEAETITLHRTDDRNWEHALKLVVKTGGPSGLIDTFLRKLERDAENKKQAAHRQLKLSDEKLEIMQKFRETFRTAMGRGE